MDYLEEIKMLQEEKHEQGKYSIFDTEFIKKLIEENKISENIFNMLKEWNEKINLPLETGNFLNEIVNDSKNTVAIHRTYIGDIKVMDGQVESNIITNIAEHGLKNSQLDSETTQTVNDPCNTLTSLKDLEGFINLIASYKYNNAVIIYSFPSEHIDADLRFNSVKAIGKICDFDDHVSRFKPEYLVGIILKNNNNDIFLSRDEMLNLNNNKTK